MRLIVEAYLDTGSIDLVAERYNQLTRKQIEAALDYRDYPARIDEDSERNARAWAALTTRPWRD